MFFKLDLHPVMQLAGDNADGIAYLLEALHVDVPGALLES